MKRASLVLVALVTVTLVLGCGGTPGAQPHDMSAAGHEAMASSEEQSAREHRDRYEPDAGARVQECRHRAARSGGEVCWTSTANPTEEHLRHAEEHRKRAADHRAASQALRDAEARACTGIAVEDRDQSPFQHREDIASVEPLNVLQGGKQATDRLEGAVIVFRALPGMTAQWLQRVIDCHLARNAALGHDVPEMPYCPLVPKDVTASVTPTANGFAVAVRANDAATANEVLRRSRQLPLGAK